MIHTAKQLKDKVKNMSGGNSEVAQALIRTYRYKNTFFLVNILFCTADCKSCDYGADCCRRYWIPYLGGYKES